MRFRKEVRYLFTESSIPPPTTLLRVILDPLECLSGLGAFVLELDAFPTSLGVALGLA